MCEMSGYLCTSIVTFPITWIVGYFTKTEINPFENA